MVIPTESSLQSAWHYPLLLLPFMSDLCNNPGCRYISDFILVSGDETAKKLFSHSTPHAETPGSAIIVLPYKLFSNVTDVKNQILVMLL